MPVNHRVFSQVLEKKPCKNSFIWKLILPLQYYRSMFNRSGNTRWAKTYYGFVFFGRDFMLLHRVSVSAFCRAWVTPAPFLRLLRYTMTFTIYSGSRNWPRQHGTRSDWLQSTRKERGLIEDQINRKYRFGLINVVVVKIYRVWRWGWGWGWGWVGCHQSGQKLSDWIILLLQGGAQKPDFMKCKPKCD